MRRLTILLFCIGLVLTEISVLGTEAHAFQVNPAALQRIEYPMPESASARQYLGLSGAGGFHIPDVKANVLIIEVFSMYCPYCQAEAPTVNKLYDRIDRDPALRGRVKILGIGITNTPYEVEVFRKKFGVRFPLLADQTSSIQQIAQEKFRTPTFVVLKIGGGNVSRVVKVQVGRIPDFEDFFKSVSEF